MKLLANENFPKASVLLLRELGYDVASIGLDNPSVSDRAVIEIAEAEDRLIITFDRDYGELVYKHHFKPEGGVLYLRLMEYTPVQPGQIVHELLSVFKLETRRRFTVYNGEITSP